MMSRPPPLMASRALTARFSSASSNSLLSIATGHRPGAIRTSTAMSPRRLDCRRPCIAGRRSARSITTVSWVWRREKDSSWRVRPAPRLTAMSMASSAPARRGSRADQAAQALGVAAHHHQEVVEVVGDAAGELADRLEPLRLLQRRLGRLAALQLPLALLGAAQRVEREAEQRQHRRQDDGGAHQHGAAEIGRERSGLDADRDIERVARHAAVAEAAFDAVDARGRREQPALGIAREGLGQGAARRPIARRAFRPARQDGAVGAHQGEDVAAARQLGVEFAEMARR